MMVRGDISLRPSPCPTMLSHRHRCDDGDDDVKDFDTEEEEESNNDDTFYEMPF